MAKARKPRTAREKEAARKRLVPLKKCLEKESIYVCHARMKKKPKKGGKKK